MLLLAASMLHELHLCCVSQIHCLLLWSTDSLVWKVNSTILKFWNLAKTEKKCHQPVGISTHPNAKQLLENERSCWNVKRLVCVFAGSHSQHVQPLPACACSFVQHQHEMLLNNTKTTTDPICSFVTPFSWFQGKHNLTTAQDNEWKWIVHTSRNLLPAQLKNSAISCKTNGKQQRSNEQWTNRAGIIANKSELKHQLLCCQHQENHRNEKHISSCVRKHLKRAQRAS